MIAAREFTEKPKVSEPRKVVELVILVPAFFRAVNLITAGMKAEGRSWWEWDEWKRFFQAARDTNTWLPDLGADGKPNGAYRSASSAFGINVGQGVQKQWDRCQEARAKGLTAMEFHLSENARIEDEKQALKRALEAQRAESARRAKANGRKGNRTHESGEIE